MAEYTLSRRALLMLLGAGAAAPALAACGSSVGGGSGSGGEEGGPVKVGLVVPQSGVYAPLGTDMQRGWDLWLQQHGNRIGGREVTTVVADEGENPQTGVPAVQRVLQADQVDLVVGLVNSATALGAAPLMSEAKKILVVANAGAADITGKARTPYVWRTSFQNAQVAAAAGPHLAEQNIPGGVFLIASDYAAGTEVRAGFKAAYEAAGGRIAGEASPPFGTTQDYQPFLAQIRQSGAGAVFCFFAGAEAVRFVQQYAQFGLKDSVPLYGSGFLTEGGVLDAQAEAALGVRTSLFYTDQLDNPANRAFVEAYRAAYDDAVPTCYSVSTFDAAAVLDRALGAATALDGDSVSAALGGVGSIDDSPRGPWTFDGQNPLQTMYLRTVEGTPGQLVNAVTADLGQKAQV
ncbi:amino acid/amide ABC transporter substrate-binding protein, HAAT family [Pseudonocardia ammonioxydans]|uniref:Amino acid/amide ABC transporter substrate-binding protein, HAAT family n=1 Tax=Pseudonocardia ammonioxydans TaxID=260086 RepID=A0A1I4WQT6_PSUAM|nr:ABC transporter substrate-binding protein [Pseudonocardia ammonioxydans]SFN15797.1 amino acid/amide ABC transporter substrate-binding protein, HAAT family [Pseudonocardia ammonioxydans]